MDMRSRIDSAIVALLKNYVMMKVVNKITSKGFLKLSQKLIRWFNCSNKKSCITFRSILGFLFYCSVLFDIYNSIDMSRYLPLRIFLLFVTFPETNQNIHFQHSEKNQTLQNIYILEVHT